MSDMSSGGRLSRQDHYHVPDHRSWWDLFCTLNQGMCGQGAMTSWCTIQCHQVVLVVELVEASTLYTLSARKIMRSDNFKSYRLVLPGTSPVSWPAIFRLLVTINTR